MSPALDHDPLNLLHVISRLLRVLTDKRAREHGMTRTQWVLLMWVAREPGITQQAIASLLEVEPISVGRLVDRLEARGFIERRRDPADRRIWRLHNLPAATPVLEIIGSIRDELNTSLFSTLTKEQVEALVDTLRAIKANLLEERSAPDTNPDKPSHS